jgi:hypothetical protein
MGFEEGNLMGVGSLVLCCSKYMFFNFIKFVYFLGGD